MEAVTHESARRLVNLKAEEHGWAWQQAYINALRTVVLRKRPSCNSIQQEFWMAQAEPYQVEEAYHAALAIIEAANLL